MSFLEIGGLFGSITSGYVTDKLVQKVGSASFTLGTNHLIALGEKRLGLVGLFEELGGYGLANQVSQPSILENKGGFNMSLMLKIVHFRIPTCYFLFKEVTIKFYEFAY